MTTRNYYHELAEAPPRGRTKILREALLELEGLRDEVKRQDESIGDYKSNLQKAVTAESVAVYARTLAQEHARKTQQRLEAFERLVGSMENRIATCQRRLHDAQHILTKVEAIITRYLRPHDHLGDDNVNGVAQGPLDNANKPDPGQDVGITIGND